MPDGIRPLPKTRFEVTPSPAELESFRENGFLVVERITSDEEIAWMREVFEFIFSEEQAGRRDAPVDPSGTPAPGEPSMLSQALFPPIPFPQLPQTQHRRNASRAAPPVL